MGEEELAGGQAAAVAPIQPRPGVGARVGATQPCAPLLPHTLNVKWGRKPCLEFE